MNSVYPSRESRYMMMSPWRSDFHEENLSMTASMPESFMARRM